MKFPEVSNLGAVVIPNAGRFVLLMVKDDWAPDETEHESEHARGQCECPCAWRDPLGDLLRAATPDTDEPEPPRA